MLNIQSIICDDIRTELGGKSSFMGVYRARMYLPELPAVLPRFCITILITEDDYALPFRFEVYVPGKDEPVIVHKDDSPDKFTEHDKPVPLENPVTREAGLIIEGFEIDQEGSLNLKVFRDEKLVLDRFVKIELIDKE